MNNILTPLLESTKLQEYFVELRDFIKEEQQRRKDFYDFLTEEMKAEFIKGEVKIHSPVTDEHKLASSNLFTLLKVFSAMKDNGRVSHEKLMIALTRNSYEPDICFFNKNKAKKFIEGQKLFPTPDFIAEVLSKSTEKFDRGIKFEDYALHGVKEYWLIDPRQRIIEKYLLIGEKFVQKEKLTNGDISIKIIKGFSIPVEAVFDKKIFATTVATISNTKK